MSLKRKFIHIIRFSLILLPVIFCLLVGLYFYLPVYVGSHVIPQLASQAKTIGIEDLSCKVRRIGLTGTDFGAISIGEPDKAVFSIASLQIDYTPESLYQKKIDRIVFSGVDLYCGVRNGKFFLRGLDLEKILSQPSEKTESDDTTLPISIGSVEIHKARVIFQWEEKEYQIPLELKIRLEYSWKIFHAEIILYPGSRKIILTGTIDLNRQIADLNIDGRGILIERFSDFAATLIQDQLVLSGELDINAETKIHLTPFQIISLSAEAEFRNHGTCYKTFRLGKNPFNLKLTGKGDAGEWNLFASSFSLAAPLPLEMASMQIQLDMPQKRDNGVIKYDVNISDIKTDDRTIEIPSLALQGEIETNRYTFDLKSLNTRIATSALDVRFPDISISGRFNKENLRFDSTTTLKNADFSSPLLNLKIDAIQAVIPLKIPCENSGSEGDLSAKRIHWNQMNMGAITGFIQQKSSDFMFEIKNDNQLIPELKLTCWGKFPIPFGFKPVSDDAAASEIHLWFSRHKNAPDIDLGKFFPKAKGMRVNGDLDAKINWIFDPVGGNRSLLRSKLDHGLFKYTTASPDNKAAAIEAEGISLNFAMPDLSGGCSAPKQQLFFKSASFGNMRITEGKIDFQLESGNAFLIEKSSFKWCGGNVSSEALRILPGVDDYDLTLYCDRLNLAKVLGQFGAGNAEGEGAVSGRIPLGFKNGEFSFHDGFLFSTPGDGGTIHITNTDMLTAGIPKDTLQYAQIDLAREALKNFEYKWVKLRLNTEKENLKLKLQFDGKPAKPLPFVYQKEFGGFARVESGTKSSHFQGISLDVNMGLPLNKLLLYKEILKSF